MPKKVLILGSTGFIGSNLMAEFGRHDCFDLLCPTRADLDLSFPGNFLDYLVQHRPDVILMAAGASMGVFGNRESGESLSAITNQCDVSLIYGLSRCTFIRNVIYFCPSCMYPQSSTPLSESSVWSGPIEESSASYSTAKLRTFLDLELLNRSRPGLITHCLVPSGLFGPKDSLHADTAHVVPALIMKLLAAAKAKSETFVVRGTGAAVRQFLYIEDFCRVVSSLIMRDEPNMVLNIAPECGVTSISSLVDIIRELTNFDGSISYSNEFVGTQRKVLSNERFRKVFPEFTFTKLPSGLEKTVGWYRGMIA